MRRRIIFAAYAFAFFCSLSISGVSGKLGPPGGPQKLHHDVADPFKQVTPLGTPTSTLEAKTALVDLVNVAFTSFTFAVAISDADNDTVFECMHSRRISLDSEAKSADYVWYFPRLGEALLFHVTAGSEPGTFTLTMEDDPTVLEGKLYYTDYGKCVIADVEYMGHRCTLWANAELKDNVPQECIDQFVDTCGVIVPPHSRDLCPDGEGDY